MSADTEPFFTPGEWRATTLFRPGEWREWWRTEPRFTKVFAGGIALLLCLGIVEAVEGEPSGWPMIYVIAAIVATILLMPFLVVLAASVRWALRNMGVAAVWRGVREQVFTAVRVLFWLGFVVLIVSALWPYLSLDPAKSWYAFSNKVPVDHVVIEKKPHDCEFMTAPVGDKHCHYDPKPFVFPASDNADHQNAVVVSYEKLEE